MIRFLCLIVLLILVFPITVVRAQTEPDIDAVAAELERHSAGETLGLIEQPISDDLLPDTFGSVQPMDASLEASELTAFQDAGLDGLVGVHTFNVAELETARSEKPVATPQDATSPAATAVILSVSGSYSYVVTETPIDTATLPSLAESLIPVFTSGSGDTTTEEFTIDGHPAISINNVSEVNMGAIHMQWILVPVGNVLVISSVVAQGDADPAALHQSNLSLVKAAIVWLGESIQETPVG